MSFQQIRDILKNMATYHDELHEFIAVAIEANGTAIEDDGRREWLLKYVEAQTRAVSEALAQPPSAGNHIILETWLQYIPDEEIQRCFRRMRSTTDPDWEELVELVQGFDLALRNLCSTLADQTSVPGIREMFEMIGSQSQHYLEQSVWGMRSNGGPESNHLVTDDEQSVE
jgi:hypothetical protein